MTNVIVASRPIASGMPVNAADTRRISVHVTDKALTTGWMASSDLVAGWVAAVPVGEGEPITLSEVQRTSAGPVLGEMSIAVPVEQAAGGLISEDDLVDVIAASANGGAYYVAQGLRVISVASTSGSDGVLGAGPAGGDYYVVVAVGKRVALRIAAALGAEGGGSANSQIEVVRANGEKPISHASYALPNLTNGAGRP
jgi:hypothetical protein